MQSKLVHAAERKAFKTALDRLIAKGQNEKLRSWPTPSSV